MRRARTCYDHLAGELGVALTWRADVFEIISYASRAFAAYYAMFRVCISSFDLKTPGRGEELPGDSAQGAALAGQKIDQ